MSREMEAARSWLTRLSLATIIYLSMPTPEERERIERGDVVTYSPWGRWGHTPDIPAGASPTPAAPKGGTGVSMSPLEAAIARLTEEIKRQQDAEVRARLKRAAAGAAWRIMNLDRAGTKLAVYPMRDVILDELSKEGFPTG